MVGGMILSSMVGVGQAHAEQGWRAQTFKVMGADSADTARIANNRLRKTRYEETNEQAVTRLFGDGQTGLFVQMQSASINGQAPVHRQQAACYPVKLTQAADGSVTAQSNGAPRFVTANIGQDYRNANKPEITPINGGKNMLLTYNYRPNGTNDTNRYAKVLDAQCNEVPVVDANGQARTHVLIMHKDNDNCDMHQSGEGPGDVATDDANGTHVVFWAGCNGNGLDDGWMNDITVKALNGGSQFQIAKNFDISVEPNEERTRGRCSVADADPNTAICTWTAGNTQPQRNGTWIGAIDISPNGEQGEQAQSRLLWKKQIDGQNIVGGVRTCSVRANSSRILQVGNDGKLTRTDKLFVQTSDLRGNNNNDRKGGRYLRLNMGVVQANRSGVSWVIPLTDVSNQMLGIDATHLTQAAVLVQDGSKVLPAMTMMQGSQNGAGTAPADVKVLAADFASGKFVDYGTHSAGGFYDRHLYSNYLGGNPGNQGRNFAGAAFVKNPFVGQNGATSQFLLMHAVTGKDPADLDKAEMKPSAYLSIMPVMNPQATPPPPPGQPNMNTPGQNGSGGGQNAQPQPGDPQPANEMPTQAGGFSSGCSVAVGAPVAPWTGSIFLLLVGLGLLSLARRRS
jgi:MYXO-CTERM domain-containing protein